MRAEHLAELRVPMLLAGIKVQASADLVSKAFVIVLQNINIPAYLFFAFQIVQQRLPYYFISVGQQIGALSTVRPRMPSEISSKKILPQHATFPLFSRLYQQQGQTAAHRPNIRCTAVMSNAARRLIRRSVRRISRKNVEFRRFYRKRIICCCKRSPHTV